MQTRYSTLRIIGKISRARSFDAATLTEGEYPSSDTAILVRALLPLCIEGESVGSLHPAATLCYETDAGSRRADVTNSVTEGAACVVSDNTNANDSGVRSIFVDERSNGAPSFAAKASNGRNELQAWKPKSFPGRCHNSMS